MAVPLLKHASNYTLGNALMIVAGLVSFPLLTRVLSVEDYGLMNLVATVLGLLVAVGKLGMQHATLRFYSEVTAGKRDSTFEQYVSTVMYGMAAVGLVATVLWAVISQLIPSAWWNDERFKPLMLLASVLIVIRVFDSAIVNQLRAQERSGVLMTYSVVRRYVTLALLLSVLFFVAGNVWGFFAATIVGELLATVYIAWWLLRATPPRLSAFSPTLFKAMVAFGVPMIGLELSAVLLNMGNRYVIQHLIGSEALGVFSASYNMCDYIRALLLGSLVAAAQPMYMRLWEQQGPQVTSDFLTRFLRTYLAVLMLMVAGAAAIGGEMLRVLASEKYAAGGELVPVIVLGMGIETLLVITGAGLYLQKRSKVVMLLMLFCAVLNLALNYLLIPPFGLMGAAASTALAYAVLMVLGWWMGRQGLAFGIPVAATLKFAMIAALMYVAVMQIELPSHVHTMVARGAIGLVIFVGLALLLDAETRRKVSSLRARFAR